MGGSDEIIALAKRSGLPYSVGSTNRPGAVTLSGSRSWHASDDAVDFMGANQDALAAYFMTQPTAEVIHHSNRTGKNYATSFGKPFTLRGALLEQHRNHLHVAATEKQGRTALGAAWTGVKAGLTAAGSPLAGFFPNPATLTQATANVGAGLANIAESAANVGALAGMVTRAFLPSNLIRGAALMFGILFILIGIWFLALTVKDA